MNMRIIVQKIIFFTISALVFGLREVAHACPNCFASSNTQALQAYYVSIGFMALAPFAMVGGVIFWLRRKHRQFERERLPSSSSQA